jgi:DNA transformation protein
VDADTVQELFGAFGTVTVRRMFGGAGLFADSVMFGLVAGGLIYLKADETTVPDFAGERCSPFEYATKTGKRAVMSYWRLPDRLYDDPEELANWARKALSVARRNNVKPKPRQNSARNPAVKRPSRWRFRKR